MPCRAATDLLCAVLFLLHSSALLHTPDRGCVTFAGVRTRAAASSTEKDPGCFWAAGLATWAQRITLSEQLARRRLPLRSSFTEMIRGCAGNCVCKETTSVRSLQALYRTTSVWRQAFPALNIYWACCLLP